MPQSPSPHKPRPPAAFWKYGETGISMHFSAILPSMKDSPFLSRSVRLRLRTDAARGILPA